jgi:hypothetical protein
VKAALESANTFQAIELKAFLTVTEKGVRADLEKVPFD